MAELFHARRVGIEGFQQDVALKRIRPEFAHDRDFVAMFLDEARLAATLQHPNIAHVYDIGLDGGSYFFTMELLQGADLARLLRAAALDRVPLSLEHALTIVAGAAAGLHYAHERRDVDGRPLGIVHRDVTPQNIFVTRDGGVKLIDFGIAKAARRSTETREGALKGKVRYMSPEQCKSEELDRRSDVFSLSVVLWELTTGRQLYTGAKEYDLMRAIVDSDAPRPSTINPGYFPRL
jgi:serine/threonine protein kinase